MGIWDWAKYMNEVNFPEKKLKQGYHIEICFSYPDVDEVVHISETRIINTVNDGLSRGNDLGVMMRATNPIEHFLKFFFLSPKQERFQKRHQWNTHAFQNCQFWGR